ncbi:type II secretion system protein N [Acidiferrobacter sp.]|uniref:type II secretion system protein N n=1 Tax=Acidiferrobacter sp. TaxID=1872107 RepID=UPI0026393A2C|nr:type II secretion system protein N [Acidiferrobacter sp.]
MKRLSPYGVWALAAYAVCLLATVPARVVWPGLRGRLPAGVRVAGIRGTVWEGRLAVFVPAASAAGPLCEVRFRFTPLALIRGRAGYALSLAGKVQGRMRVTRGPGAWGVSNLAVTAPARVLDALVPLARTVRPRGVLALRARTLVWGRHGAGHGTLIWSKASVTGAPAGPAGDYAVRFAVADQAVSYRIRTLTGALRLTGRGRYRPASGQLSFAGDLSARSGHLRGIMARVGVADGRSRRHMAFRVIL